MKISQNKNNFHFATENRFLNFAGGENLSQRVEAELIKTKEGQKSLRDRAKLENLTGEELMKKVNEIADGLVEEGKDNAEKKMKAMKETLQAFTKELGISKKFNNQTKEDHENYQNDVAKAEKIFNERMQDFKSEREDYGGKENDDKTAWDLNLDDDIADAPEGSKTKEAFDSWTEAKNKLDVAKAEVEKLKGIPKFVKESEVRRLKEVADYKLAAIEKAIQTDRDAPHVERKQKLAEVFQKNLEAHQEGKRDKEAIAELVKKYEGRLPEDFKLQLPQIAIRKLRLQLGEGERFADVQEFLTDKNRNELFKNWDELKNGLTDDAKTAFVNFNKNEQEGMLKMFNQAILLKNAEEFQKERDEILKTPSKPKKVAENPATPVAAEVAATPEVTTGNNTAEESEVGNAGSSEADGTLSASAMQGVQNANFETSMIENLKLNREAIRVSEFNENGRMILNELEGKTESLNELEITEGTMLEKGKRGLQGIADLQEFLKKEGMKGEDVKVLAIDGLAGRNTIHALENYLTAKNKINRPKTMAI